MRTINIPDSAFTIKDLDQYKHIDTFPMVDLNSTFNLRLGYATLFWSSPYVHLHKFLSKLACIFSRRFLTIYLDTGFKAVPNDFDKDSNLIVIQDNSVDFLLEYWQKYFDLVPVWIISDISTFTGKTPDKALFRLRDLLSKFIPLFSSQNSCLICGDQSRATERDRIRPWGNTILSFYSYIIKISSTISEDQVLLDFNFKDGMIKRSSAFQSYLYEDSIYMYLVRQNKIKVSRRGIFSMDDQLLGDSRLDFCKNLRNSIEIFDIIKDNKIKEIEGFSPHALF